MTDTCPWTDHTDDRPSRSRWPGLTGLALGLIVSMMLVSPGEAWGKKGKAPKVSTLTIVQAGASSEGPLGPDDFVRARLDYALSSRDRGAGLTVRAKLWAVKPFSSGILPVEVSTEEPFSARTGTIDVVVRLKQAFVDENFAHPLQLAFTISQSDSSGIRIIATSGRLELETQLQRMAWNDPARMAELVASGEPLPYSSALGMTPPQPIKGKLPRGSRGAGLVGQFLLTIDAEGKVQDVKILGSAAADTSLKTRQEFRSWRFRPATYQGQPVAVTYIYSLRFN